MANLRLMPLSWAIVGALLLGAAAQVPTPEQQEVFAQLDRFDALDTKPLRFVKVATGNWIQYGDDPPVNRYRYGFLTDEEDARFTVRCVDLTRITLVKTGPGKAEHERVGFEAVDLAQYARVLARRFEDADYADSHYLRPDATMAPRAEALLLARACARRGLTEEVGLLWKSIDLTKAREEVGQGLRSQLCMHFADKEPDWAELLRRHRQWLESFPKDWGRKAVDERATILQRMITEERAYQKRRAGKGKSESAEDLIHRLRHERYPVKHALVDGYYLTSADVVDDKRPVSRIRKLGFAAVPALIEAVDDTSLTRCVWYHSRYGGSFWVVSVGSFARELLEEIGGVTFYGSSEEVQASWRKWWDSVSVEGEEATYAELAARGDHTSVPAARRLLARWPKNIGTVIRGTRVAENRWVRQQLMALLADRDAEEVVTFLIDEAMRGPYVTARVDAARMLLARGRDDGVQVFIREWSTAADPRERPQPGVPKSVRDFDLRIAKDEARGAMAALLLQCGSPDAISTVAKGLAEAPARVRAAVVEAVLGHDVESLLQYAKPDHRPGIEQGIEDILATLLSDHNGMGGSRGMRLGDTWVSLLNPRTGDLAALAMSALWPERYAFDAKGPSTLRDRRLRQLENVWRARKGKDPLPVPPVPDVRSKDPRVRALIASLRDAEDAAQRASIASQVAETGLGALPWVEDTLRALPSDHAARADLDALANRLARVTRAVAIKAKDWKPPPSVQKRIVETEGRALTPDLLAQLFKATTDAFSGARADVALTVEYLADSNGVAITLTVSPLPGAAGVSQCNRSLFATANGRQVHYSGAGGTREAMTDPADWAEVLEELLAAPRGQTCELRVEVELR